MRGRVSDALSAQLLTCAYSMLCCVKNVVLQVQFFIVIRKPSTRPAPAASALLAARFQRTSSEDHCATTKMSSSPLSSSCDPCIMLWPKTATIRACDAVVAQTRALADRASKNRTEALLELRKPTPSPSHFLAPRFLNFPPLFEYSRVGSTTPLLECISRRHFLWPQWIDHPPHSIKGVQCVET